LAKTTIGCPTKNSSLTNSLQATKNKKANIGFKTKRSGRQLGRKKTTRTERKASTVQTSSKLFFLPTHVSERTGGPRAKKLVYEFVDNSGDEEKRRREKQRQPGQLPQQQQPLSITVEVSRRKKKKKRTAKKPKPQGVWGGLTTGQAGGRRRLG